MHASNEEVRLPDDQVGLASMPFTTPNTPAPEFPGITVATTGYG
jgi:hypothetical protein